MLKKTLYSFSLNTEQKCDSTIILSNRKLVQTTDLLNIEKAKNNKTIISFIFQRGKKNVKRVYFQSRYVSTKHTT